VIQPGIIATDYQAIVRPLQWFVVGLIFLFFLRVIRAVYVETRPGGRRRERTPRSARGLGLEVLEPVDRLGDRYEVPEGQAVAIGRAVSCELAIPDDVYASNLHARVYREGRSLVAEDMASTNGTYVNAERIEGPTRLSRGDVLQVGGTVFEVVR